VTVLTSLDAAVLAAVGLAGPPDDAVRRLATLAVEAGAHTLVCGPREVRMVRLELGDSVTLITPGVRPVGSEAADQARIATPGEALEAGADLVVVGRPITRATDLGMAARAVADSISAGSGPVGT
jgi:orotidine-5'-phosphate decarboxylase